MLFLYHDSLGEVGAQVRPGPGPVGVLTVYWQIGINTITIIISILKITIMVINQVLASAPGLASSEVQLSFDQGVATFLLLLVIIRDNI